MGAKTIALNMVMNTDQFRRDVKVAQDSIRDLSTQTQKAKEIASNFKFAGFDTSQLSQMKSQFETAGKLQDKLFTATHTNLQVSLARHKSYFDDLRIKWQSNESMLTLINKTESAERTKILTNYGKSTTSSMQSILSMYSKILHAAAATYLVKSFMDLGTAMAKAKTSGESMFDAFVSNLPMFKNIKEAAVQLGTALADLKLHGQITSIKNYEKVFEAQTKLSEEMKRNTAIAAAGENSSKLKAVYAYNDRLDQIALIEKETEAIKKQNAVIDQQIDSLKKGKNIAVQTLTGDTRIISVKSNPQVLKKEIEDLQSKKVPLDQLDINFGDLRSQARDEFQANVKSLNSKVSDSNKDIISSTKDAMQQMRSMDYLTRMERIENLKDYQTANAETLDAVSDANEIVNQEIQNLERSRVDAMKVYQAELREDMQDSALYTSEKWAESARSIEGSMSSAFDSMITKGASFKDAMRQFLSDIASSFSRMASDMAARGIMNMAINAGIGSLFSGGFGPGGVGTISQDAVYSHEFHRGGIAGGSAPGRYVPSSLFADAPRLHGGSTSKDKPWLNSNEYPAIMLKGEPAGERGIQEYLQKNGKRDDGRGINFSPNMKVVIVHNEREAYLEAMNSAEGEKVVVKHVAKNRRMLG